jgi:hypothetical protein
MSLRLIAQNPVAVGNRFGRVIIAEAFASVENSA